ncbi:hypothetical protein [Streptomyces paludis]|uniref:hypothetical protein n=1 Tax=Streptomyces paludis TaxID=2282738 RepID=UPI0013B3DCF0|nr:hypothetical protein [Streptomyces paludis]
MPDVCGDVFFEGADVLGGEVAVINVRESHIWRTCSVEIVHALGGSAREATGGICLRETGFREQIHSRLTLADRWSDTW